MWSKVDFGIKTDLNTYERDHLTHKALNILSGPLEKNFAYPWPRCIGPDNNYCNKILLWHLPYAR